MPMPKGRPESAQHTLPYILIGLAQGLLLTISLALLVSLGL